MKKSVVVSVLLISIVIAIFAFQSTTRNVRGPALDEPPALPLRSDSSASQSNATPGEESDSQREILSDYSRPALVPNTIPTLSVFPSDPFDVFMSHIDNAKNSNIESQYLVSTVLEECVGVPSGNDARKALLDELAEKYQDDDDGSEFLSADQFRMDRCAKLADAIGKIERKAAEYYYDAALAGDHPAAKMRELLMSSALVTIDPSLSSEPLYEAHSIIKRALSAGHTESWANVSALYALYMGPAGLDNYVDREAWNLLSCTAIPACPVGQNRAELEQRYIPAVAAEIVDRADQIKAAVKTEQWGTIGLTY